MKMEIDLKESIKKMDSNNIVQLINNCVGVLIHRNRKLEEENFEYKIKSEKSKDLKEEENKTKTKTKINDNIKRKWTDEDFAILESLYFEGKNHEEIALKLNRTIASVNIKIWQQCLKEKVQKLSKANKKFDEKSDDVENKIIKEIKEEEKKKEEEKPRKKYIKDFKEKIQKLSKEGKTVGEIVSRIKKEDDYNIHPNTVVVMVQSSDFNKDKLKKKEVGKPDIMKQIKIKRVLEGGSYNRTVEKWIWKSELRPGDKIISDEEK